ncbi:MAG TPA: peptidylprolyl isomerase [Melioribacteraceae bacterium]|nr:peptidylprolyl isomerase [Melioribacteraceae bacterium]
MIKIILPILLLTINFITLFSQSLNVAKIGNDFISDKEFKIRFETMPHITDDSFNLDSVKVKILHTIIAEKLWSKYAIEKGIDTTTYFKMLFKPTERLFIRDALYKKVIEPFTELSGDDINFITKYSNSKVIADIYAFDDSISANTVYLSLQKNYTIPGNIKVFADTSKEITIGFMEDEELEKQILTAQSMFIFPPFKTSAGWFVIHKRNNLRIAETTDKQNISTLKQKMIERRAKKIGAEYLGKLFSDIKLSVNEDIFNNLVNSFFDIYNKKISIDSSLKFKSLLIDELDIKDINNIMYSQLNKILIDANNLKFATIDFTSFIMYQDFKLKNATKEGIAKKLLDYIKFFVEQELITEEGIKQNLQNSPAVKNELKMWKENLLAQLIENSFVDTMLVTDTEVIEEYNKRYSEKKIKEEIKVQEILVDNLEQVENILNKLEIGNDFDKLAENSTLRENLKIKKGIIGYITKDMFGDIGRIASELKINDVYGPIKTIDGYSIIKILDKKIDSSKASFESVKDIIKQGLFSEKSYKLLNNKTVDLAKKYGIDINFTNLTNIRVTNINMFTHRFMGFGGKIAASPFTNNIYEWYQIYKKLQKESL